MGVKGVSGTSSADSSGVSWAAFSASSIAACAPADRTAPLSVDADPHEGDRDRSRIVHGAGVDSEQHLDIIGIAMRASHVLVESRGERRGERAGRSAKGLRPGIPIIQLQSDPDVRRDDEVVCTGGRRDGRQRRLRLRVRSVLLAASGFFRRRDERPRNFGTSRAVSPASCTNARRRGAGPWQRVAEIARKA